MARVKEIEAREFEAEVLNSSQPVIADFRADWCMPCRMLEPVMEEVASEYEGKVKVVKLDVGKEDVSELAGKFGVMSIPTLLFVKGGEVKERLVGAVPKEEIEEVIERVFGV